MPASCIKRRMPVSIGHARRMEYAQFAILPYRETAWTKTTVRLIAGVLAVILVAIIMMRRKKKKGAEDDF